MELMELVENEPTARPFQCDWQSCNKVCSPSCSPRASLKLGGNWNSVNRPGGKERGDEQRKDERGQQLTTTAELQPQVGLATALPHTHQRTAVPVHYIGMWQELHPEERSHGSHTDSYRREAAPVPAHGLRQAVFGCRWLSSGLSKQTSGN